MTTPPPTGPANIALPVRRPLAARLPLLGLYPAKYRAAHGEEIAAVFAETVQDTGPGTALREWTALAAHALRLRTRLSSTDPLGRIAAGAAPFILAGAAGLSMVRLLTGLFLLDHFGSEDFGLPVSLRALMVAQACPWVLALLCASLGRWTPARILVLLGILGRIGSELASTPSPRWAFTLFLLLLLPAGLVPGTLLLITPPDAVDLTARGRSRLVLAFLALAVPMSALAVCWPRPDPIDIFFGPTGISPVVQNLLDACAAWPVAVMSLALLLHLGAPRPDRLHAAGIAVAVLPWTAMLAPPYYLMPSQNSHDLLRNAGVVLAFLATATLLAHLRHTLRRSRPTDPPTTT
ncbi:hypothetical protein [Kitasatospora aureofaciens]|uniref:hypothetical protein n=1 Tax=Kitasatospora aureofaciens TaxID=1894 RepID=UPI00382948E6